MRKLLHKLSGEFKGNSIGTLMKLMSDPKVSDEQLNQIYYLDHPEFKQRINELVIKYKVENIHTELELIIATLSFFGVGHNKSRLEWIRDWKKQKIEGESWNKFIDLIMDIPEIDKFHNLSDSLKKNYPVSEIKIFLKSGDSISLKSFLNVAYILRFFKKHSNLKKEPISKLSGYNSIKREAAKALKEYFNKYTQYRVPKGKKVTTELSNLIFDTLLCCYIIKDEKNISSLPKDYIRTLLR